MTGMPQLECDMTGDKKGTVEGTFYVAKGVAWSDLRLSGTGPYMAKTVNGVKVKHGKAKWGCSACSQTLLSIRTYFQNLPNAYYVKNRYFYHL